MLQCLTNYVQFSRNWWQVSAAGPDSVTLFAYDGLGRAVSRTVTNAAGTVSTTVIVYDTLGNAVTN